MDNQAGLTAKQIKRREYDKKRRATPEAKERQREQWKKYSQVQANKDKIAEAHQKRMLDPEYREKRIQKVRNRRAEDPEFKERESEYHKKYRQANKDKIAEGHQKRYADPEYREKRKQYGREYNQTPICKKSKKKDKWIRRGVLLTDKEFERIYNLYLTQELCNACDCVLTRGGMCNTRACMDHCHETGLFRHIICHTCNTMDNWKKHFC